MKKITILYSILFLLIVYLPSSLMIAYRLHITSKTFQVFKLEGYFESHKRPSFSKHSYANGNYQKDFEKWLNSRISFRGFYIRLYNQIQFSIFKLSNRIIGKNDDIFEIGYINTECGFISDFSNHENYQKLNEYVNHLENIQNKLRNIGKYFIFYITPSKATQNFNNIPLKYRLKKPKEYKAPYYYLKKLLSETSINYLDSRDFFSTDGTPDFYTTGIHWARPIEQRVSQAIVENLSSQSNQKLPKIILNELTLSNVPIKRDADVFNLANIFEKPQDTYYEYEAETKAELDSLKPNFMIQGGSFAEGFYNYDYADFTKNSYKFFYNRLFLKKDEAIIKITKWEDVDFTEILDNVDFVVVELNEAVIPNFSNGFVEYLDSFLDRYIAKQPLQDVNNGF